MKALISIIILAVVGWGIYALVHKNSVQPTSTQVIDNTDNSGIPMITFTDVPPATGTSTTSTESSTTSTAPLKEFTVTGKNFSFLPNTLTVNKGDRVRITFKNENGNHDWNIDEFNAKTKVISGGQSETIEFVADKTGSFEYYCSVGTHRQMGMKGTLRVK